jgi:hypothetical protein
MPPSDSTDPDAALAAEGAALVDAVNAVIGGWVVRCIESRARSFDREFADAVAARATDDVTSELRALLAVDVDAQTSNPMAVLRAAVRYPTEVLRAAGVAVVPRDEFAERTFPDDVYDLTPASFADVDPSLHEPGLRWGAAKAYAHLHRRRH